MYQADLAFFQSTRNQTLQLVEGLTQAQSEFLPSPGRWSVGEVLDHLLLAEALNRGEVSQLIEMAKSGQKPYLNRSFTDLNVSIAFIPKFMLPFFEVPFRLLNMVVPTPVREFVTRYRLIPAQNPDVGTPRKGRPIDELRHELRSSLRETEALFEANPALDYRMMIHQHPLTGANNVLQLLRFIASHEQRHQSQISDILRLPSFPRAA
jgi:uncharacterized damage-inducible protein DinB